MTAPSEARWLLLIHQIPPKPNYLRVKVWRRLQRLGAVAIKNSVYVLPRNEQTLEDFQWVFRELVASGGDASICEAHFVEGVSDEQIEALFHAARTRIMRKSARRRSGSVGISLSSSTTTGGLGSRASSPGYGGGSLKSRKSTS